MYGPTTAEAIGIVGDTLRHEVNFLAYNAWVTQEARIKAAVQDSSDQQVENLQNFLSVHGKGKFGGRRGSK